MNETRIAAAFVALGIALLVGTFAYLASGLGDDSRSALAPAARSASSAAPGEQEESRPGARTGADGSKTAGADSLDRVRRFFAD